MGSEGGHTGAHPEEKSTHGARAAGIAFWVVIWFVVAAAIGNELLFAGPVSVVESFAESLASADYWSAVAASSVRIVLAMVVTALAGIALACLAYRFKTVETLFAPALQVMKSAPVACVIVIVLVAFGAQGALIVIVAFVSLPAFYTGTLGALRARPVATEQVLHTEGVSRWKVFSCCTWPAAVPLLVTAAKTAVALSWRAGVTAELLCLPLNSIGSGVYLSKLTLDSSGLIVWTITVMLLSWVTEKLVVALLSWSAHLGEFALQHRKSSASAQYAAVAPLSLDDVSFSYGDRQILDAFTLHVEPGERYCLMAPTGSGKTTAFALLTGHLMPATGQGDHPAILGVMLQTPTLVEGLTAKQNVALAASPAVDMHEIEAELERLVSKEAPDLKPAALSGGMKRLVELVRAMLCDGQAVVLDEPFAGLDVTSRRRACQFILENLHERPLVIATHDPEDAKLLNAHIVTL